MSLVYKTHIYEKPIRDAERMHPEYRFFFALITLALALVLASVMFPDAFRPGGEFSLVGP
jgi:hypothetical protein